MNQTKINLLLMKIIEQVTVHKKHMSFEDTYKLYNIISACVCQLEQDRKLEKVYEDREREQKPTQLDELAKMLGVE